MPLNPEELQRLPESIRRLMQNESLGIQADPLSSGQDSGNAVLSDLQGALGRRFGQQYGADFDPEYDAGVRGLLSQVPQHQAQFQNRRQRMGEDFYRSAEDLDRMNTRTGEQHEIKMADQGMLRSGANLVGQERLGEQFQRGVQGLTQARQRGLTDLAGEESGVYQRIRGRQSELEASGTERARVREERRRWEEEQRRMEEDRMRREEDMRNQELQARQQEQASAEARLRQVEAAALAGSQPYPTSTGGYARPAGGGGGAPALNNNTNVSVDSYEYNLRDPNEVRELQQYLGLSVDGVYGPATQQALEQNRAAFFDDRPINRQTRDRTWRSL